MEKQLRDLLEALKDLKENLNVAVEKLEEVFPKQHETEVED